MSKHIRLGVVPYLNALPLVEELEQFTPREAWTIDTPRRLAEAMAEGSLDMALLSSVEGLRRGYRMVSGAAIGSDGPVRSVALVSKVPVKDVRTVLLDAASLTSVLLLQLLLPRLTGEAKVKFKTSAAPITPDYGWKSDPHDAFLVIGNTALAWENTFPHRLDLGQAWQAATRLPFVYAAWWVRPGVAMNFQATDAVTRSRTVGEARIPQIVARLGEDQLAPYGGRASVEQYLSRSIRYGLATRELEGLIEFKRQLTETDLLQAESAPVAAASGRRTRRGD